MRDPIDVLSEKISNNKLLRGQKSREVTEYIYAIGLNMVGVILITALFGKVLGTYNQVITSMMSFFVLRKFSGGFHLRSLTLCLVVTVFLFTVIPFINVPTLYIQIINSVTIVLLVLYAPNNMKQIPVIFQTPLKVISVIIVVTNYFIIDSNIALSFLAQSLLLIPTREVKQ